MPIYKVTSPPPPSHHPSVVVNGNGFVKHQTADSPRGEQRVASAAGLGCCGGETGAVDPSAAAAAEAASSLAELTEADRDTELLRRDLEDQRVQVRSQGADVDRRHWTVDAKSKSSSNRRYTNNAIEEELLEQNKREQELMNSRQLVYGNHHQVSLSSTTPTTTTVESSSSIASPPPPLPPSDSVGAGTVAATRCPPRPSEPRIAEELMEQRRKETELRGRWKEMGLPVFDDDEDQTGNETNPPNPEQPPSSPPGSDPVPVRKWEEEKKTQNARVRPYDDEEEDRKPVYFPAEETPIEREIRLAGERENALRQSRGLEPLATSSDGRQVEITTTAAAANGAGYFHQNSHDPSVKESMKKLANNRLQLEMLKEKERELTLRSQGSISTISEERAGDPVRYVEIIARSPSSSSSGARPSTIAPPAAEEAIKPPGPQETASAPAAVGVGAGRGAASRQPSAVEPVNELETVFGGLQRQQPMMTLRQKPTTEKKTAAEKKILNELEEMQLREEELKTQRQSLLSATESRDDEYSSD